MGIQSLLDTQVLSITGSTGDVMTLQADGTYSAETPSGGGTPGGSSGQMQYNNAGAFGGTTAVVYAGSGSHVTVTAQTATDVPLKITGAASQTSSLMQVESSAGDRYVTIGPEGKLSLGDTSVQAFFEVYVVGSTSYLKLARPGVATPLQIATSNTKSTCTHAAGGGWQIHSTGLSVEAPCKLGGTRDASSLFHMIYSADHNIVRDRNGSTVEFSGGQGRGTDASGGFAALRGGLGSGAGTPAPARLEIPIPVASGSTLQTTWRIVLETDWTTAADDTHLKLWDVTAGTMVRVTRGAADSGGSGYRVLRIPN